MGLIEPFKSDLSEQAGRNITYKEVFEAIFFGNSELGIANRYPTMAEYRKRAQVIRLQKAYARMRMRQSQSTPDK